MLAIKGRNIIGQQISWPPMAGNISKMALSITPRPDVERN